jgi:hypothetical protein
MGKVFVHHPLKRAELRRLHEEPKPLEAAPGPSVRLQEALPDPEREKRAQERLLRRETERKLAEALSVISEHLQPIVIPGAAYLRWLVGALEAAEDRGAFIDGVNLVGLLEKVEHCLVCGAPSPAEPRSCAFLLWPDVFETFGDQSMGAVACPRCAGLHPRMYARIMAKITLNKDKPGVVSRLAKIRLLGGDREMLEWVKGPRRGNDTRIVTQSITSGRFMEVLEHVEELIVRDDKRIEEQFRNSPYFTPPREGG